MFPWIRSFIGGTASRSHRSFYKSISDLNAAANGGAIEKRNHVVGTLGLPSGVTLLMDPCFDSVVEASGFVERRAAVSVEEWRYPNGHAVLGMLELVFDPSAVIDEIRTLGSVGINSARIAVADRDDWKLHRQEIGPLREVRMHAGFDLNGKVRTAIAKRFGIAWSTTDHPMIYVASRPVEQSEYEAMRRVGGKAAGNEPLMGGFYPCLGLTHVTGSTFDRMNDSEGIGFVPIGEPSGPVAFVGPSGMGDGTYDVVGRFAENRMIGVEIRFLGDSD